MACPVKESEEVFPGKVGHVKHLNAVGDEDYLHEVDRDEGSHVAHVSGNELQRLLERLLLDEGDDLFVSDQASERQNQHVDVHENEVHVHDLLLHGRLGLVVHQGRCHVDEEGDDDHIDQQQN